MAGVEIFQVIALFNEPQRRREHRGRRGRCLRRALPSLITQKRKGKRELYSYEVTVPYNKSRVESEF